RYLPGIGLPARGKREIRIEPAYPESPVALKVAESPGAPRPASGTDQRDSGVTASDPMARGSDDGKRVLALAIVVLFVVAFWSAFEQSGSSMNLFADKHTNRMIGNFLVPASWFQVVNAGFILILAPIFALLWRKLDTRGREPSTPMKMVFGLALLGAGFLFMVIGGRMADKGVLVGPFWLIATYFLHTTGELCLSPVGLSYVTKVAPMRLASLLMAGWFLANGAGNKIAGLLAALSAQMPNGSFYMIFVATSITAAVLLYLLVPTINRLTAGARLS
ncbi:MAG: oligopeptide:H+ symporter, partial [Actinomycetota bacterium]|nr:oligopeptide:H+ symporter [Actinomycetota bacterium]